VSGSRGEMSKAREYEEAISEIRAQLRGETDLVARMSTICSVLKGRLPYTSWVGFYRVVAPKLLAAGPYQGPVGCLRIPFDRGVCGAAASTGSPQIVADVRLFSGHIACDESARSEIVIPVFDRAGGLMAVLDLDSREPAAFDEFDRAGLEILATFVCPEAEE
jgi:L-methionine (R)-S-oxide reductase